MKKHFKNYVKHGKIFKKPLFTIKKQMELGKDNKKRQPIVERNYYVGTEGIEGISFGIYPGDVFYLDMGKIEQNTCIIKKEDNGYGGYYMDDTGNRK